MAGSVEVVQRLLDSSADCNLASEVGTPLHWAVGSGHTPAAEVLLRHGADADAGNPEGVTPLLMAAAAGTGPLHLQKTADMVTNMMWQI